MKHLVIAFLAASICSAGEPSLKDTTDWLRDGIAASGYMLSQQGKDGVFIESGKLPKDVSVTECSISYSYLDYFSFRSLMYPQWGSTLKYGYTAATTDLSSASQNIRVEKTTDLDQAVFQTEITQTPGKVLGTFVIKEWGSENGGPRKLTTNESGDAKAALLFFHNEEMALRVAKALSHAVKLCGGSADPF